MKDYQTMKTSKDSWRAIIVLPGNAARIEFAMLKPELMRKATTYAVQHI